MSVQVLPSRVPAVVDRQLFWPIIASAILVSGPLRVDVRAQAELKTTAVLQKEYAEIDTRFRRQLSEIGPGGWRPNRSATGSLLFLVPDEFSPDGAKSTGRGPITAHRATHSGALFILAKQAAEAGELSLAFQWATEALRENPDHAEARRVLGYEQRDGKWLTEYGLRMSESRQPKVWHPKFGWIGSTEAARYDAGERLVGTRWVSAKDDAARRTRMEDGWSLRTDHFLVRTNHSLEAAAQLAARLERLHQIWRQLFAGYYLSDREVRELFAGRRPPRRQRQPMRVFYHRNKSEYVAALAKRQPRIAETLGIYFAAEEEAHFFANDDNGNTSQNLSTLCHEAVHQLFQESRPSSRNIGALANFWIIEGVATYFESLTEHHDEQAGLYYTIGEAAAGRLPAARERVLKDGFYVPLAQLTQWGKDDLQRQPELAKLYSQSAGLTAFLMDAEGGHYRERLVRYLTDIYAGRDDARTLATASGVSYEELDVAYRRFLERLP